MKTRILVIGIGNSGRSEILTGWLKHYGGNSLEVIYAVLGAYRSSREVITVMAEKDVRLTTQNPGFIDAHLGSEFDVVITVGDEARDRCPVYPAASEVLHCNFEDPSETSGSEEEVLNKYREIRDEIRSFVSDLSGRFVL